MIHNINTGKCQQYDVKVHIISLMMKVFTSKRHPISGYYNLLYFTAKYLTTEGTQGLFQYLISITYYY